MACGSITVTFSRLETFIIVITILGYFWGLCLLKESPAILPGRKEIVLPAAIVYFIISMLSNFWLESPVPAPELLAIGILGIVYTMGAVALLLHYKNLLHRLPQAITALFGTSALMSLLLVVLAIFSGIIFPETEPQKIAEFLFVPVFTWSLIVTGWILKHAANISHMLGFFLALALEILYLVMISALFPVVYRA